MADKILLVVPGLDDAWLDMFISFVGIPLAFLVWGLAWIWKAYRLIKGLLDLNGNKPMPV